MKFIYSEVFAYGGCWVEPDPDEYDANIMDIDLRERDEENSYEFNYVGWQEPFVPGENPWYINVQIYTTNVVPGWSFGHDVYVDDEFIGSYTVYTSRGEGFENSRRIPLSEAAITEQVLLGVYDTVERWWQGQPAL